ncbi:hypothetical protein FOYG_03281 [Fusarium oxysporum NRRL 32931]|uniref:Uncharacterized protein n=1 Tax=Fusarium oxysporum NRRL 32931 TaxID=660029 RepID=W9IWP4_FUSOX|nr:hypothetical protein FOYG_03281 [Fusarium oxysporum NRRL 32931]
MEPFLVASVCFFVVDHDHLNFAPAHPNVDNPGRGGDSVRASVMLDGRWAHRMLCSQCNAVRHRDEIWDVRLSLGRRIYCDIFIRVVRSSGYKIYYTKGNAKRHHAAHCASLDRNMWQGSAWLVQDMHVMD